jgi:hypothetical protein
MGDDFNITELVAAHQADQGGHLLDALYPPTQHQATMIHGLGMCPLNERLVDTRTVAGFGLAALDLDPLQTAFLARLG